MDPDLDYNQQHWQDQVGNGVMPAQRRRPAGQLQPPQATLVTLRGGRFEQRTFNPA